MPVVVNKGSSNPEPGKPGSPKPRAPRPKGPVEASPKVLIGAGVLLLILLVFLFHTYVSPIVPTDAAPKVTKVPPLPGMPDTFPYNTKEWQDAHKAGRASFISGVPPHNSGGPPASGSQ